MSVGEITVGVMTVGVMTVGVIRETDRDAVKQSKRPMFIFIFHIGENTDSL